MEFGPRFLSLTHIMGRSGREFVSSLVGTGKRKASRDEREAMEENDFNVRVFNGGDGPIEGCCRPREAARSWKVLVSGGRRSRNP